MSPTIFKTLVGQSTPCDFLIARRSAATHYIADLYGLRYSCAYNSSLIYDVLRQKQPGYFYCIVQRVLFLLFLKVSDRIH